MTSHPSGASIAANQPKRRRGQDGAPPRLNDLDRVEHRHTITSRGAAEPDIDKQESIRGVQYLAIRYTERLAEAGVVPSVGSRGDSYDNALAESFNGLYKTELIRHRGPWRGLDDVEYATLEYVDWFNHRRLHGDLGMIPPAEFEATFVHQPATPLLASSQ